MLTVLTLFGLSLFIGQFSAAQFRTLAAQRSAAVLAEAKQALVGDAIMRSEIAKAGYLRLPDVGEGVTAEAEGQEAGNPYGNAKDMTIIGRLPWKSLALKPLHSEGSECLWYVVSGRFKKTPPTAALNWDTQGQIDLIDASGTTVANNLAALIVSPGPVLDGQARSLAHTAYVECGGNYDARNYLDAYDGSNAIDGEVNYFVGSTNNRVASNADNKRFVMTDNDHYNDTFLFLTADDIFDPLIKRSDFSQAISQLLDDVDLQSQAKTKPISSGPTKEKGTGNVDCGELTSASNEVFCDNWKEMLFLTELSPASKITIDGSTSATTCTRVLIFAGRKTIGQSRNSESEKSDANNYLEGDNASSFNVPTASANAFDGASAFDWRSPGTDVIRCL